MELFDILNCITEKKEDLDFNSDEVKKAYPIFMINRFMSMSDEAFIPVVNEMNKYPDVDRKTHYRYFCSLIPKRKQYFKYLKKKKNIDDDVLPYIMDYFQCGMKEASQYINTLDKSTIDEILQCYVYGKGKGKRIIL